MRVTDDDDVQSCSDTASIVSIEPPEPQVRPIFDPRVELREPPWECFAPMSSIEFVHKFETIRMEADGNCQFRAAARGIQERADRWQQIKSKILVNWCEKRDPLLHWLRPLGYGEDDVDSITNVLRTHGE